MLLLFVQKISQQKDERSLHDCRTSHTPRKSPLGQTMKVLKTELRADMEKLTTVLALVKGQFPERSFYRFVYAQHALPSLANVSGRRK